MRKLEVGVKAIICNSEGKYLILKRLNPYQGEKSRRWDVPGGRIHSGEMLESALRREIHEETGMNLVKINAILSAQDILRVKDKHTVRITYDTKCAGDVVINTNEHSEYRWATKDELSKLHLDIYLAPIIKILP